MSGRRFAAAVALAAASLVSAGCDGDGDGSAGRRAEPVFTDPATPIEVGAGEAFVIELESNASTGYSWSVTEEPEPAVAMLGESTYVQPDTSLVGAPGAQRFPGEAVDAGSTQVTLTYARPFEPSPDERVVTFTITVD